MQRFCMWAWIGILLWAFCPATAWSASANIASTPINSQQLRSTPILLEADNVSYDRNLGLIVARGKVEASQQGRYVSADQLSYNERDDVLTASGNIVLREQTGETVYADFIELSDEFKQGIIRNLRLKLNDNSRIAAARARRVDGIYNNMDYAVFSPCLPCEKNPQAAPFWQIKAKQVVHDEVNQEIRYRDAKLEFGGVPVFYTPYLAHPDPSLKKRSGILAPSIANSNELGVVYRQPYFWNIEPSKDLLLEPIVMSKDGFILANEYRQRFSSGVIDVKSSLGNVDSRNGNTDDKTQRGHVQGRMALDLDDNWRMGADLNAATDKTYMRRYKFGGDDVLISRLNTEGFFNRNYFQARALAFQGLRGFDKSRTTPIILPQMNYAYNSDRDSLGGLWNVQTDLLNLERVEGTDSRRAVIDAEWKRPFRTDSGQLIDLTLRTVSAGYQVNDYDDPLTPAVDERNGWRGRVVPQAALTWRYPLAGTVKVDNRERLTKYIEPVVAVIASPNVGDNDLIPNEDSQSFEFDESNLFALKRFPGYDRIAGGQRIDYGVNLGLFNDASRGGKVFIGQSWRPREDNTYTAGSGLEHHFSDVVGKVEINPSDVVDLVYRFRLDTGAPALRRSEFSIITHTGPLKMGLDYMFLDRLAGNGEFNDREQLGARASYQIAQNWNISGHIVTDINSSNATREFATGVTYHNECFSAGLNFERDFTQDGENEPGSSIIFRIDLKHLGGEIQQDYFTPSRGNVYTGTLLPQ